MLPILLQIGPVKIYSMGVFLAIGIFLSLYWWWKMGRDEHLDEIELFDSYFVTLIAMGVGSRLGYVAFHWSDLGTLYRMLAILAFPGLDVISGVVVSLIVITLLARERSWELPKIWDMAAVTASVFGVFISIGALLNGSGRNVWVDGWLALGSLATFVIVSRVRKNFRFYAWYKGQSSVAKEGLAGWMWVLLMGVVCLGLGGWWHVGGGLLLVTIAGYGIYANVGRREPWWKYLLQLVRLRRN